MTLFSVNHCSKTHAARTGTLTSGNKTLSTPAVLLDTRGGLPALFSPEQVKLAKLPAHGYMINLGDIFYLTTSKSKHNSKNDQNLPKSEKSENCTLQNYYNYSEKTNQTKPNLSNFLGSFFCDVHC